MHIKADVVRQSIHISEIYYTYMVCKCLKRCLIYGNSISLGRLRRGLYFITLILTGILLTMSTESEGALERLKSIFLDTFTGDIFEFSLETTQYNIGEWDSLNHIRLLAAIENEFDLQFELREIENLTDVSALFNAICVKAITT